MLQLNSDFTCTFQGCAAVRDELVFTVSQVAAVPVFQ